MAAENFDEDDDWQNEYPALSDEEYKDNRTDRKKLKCLNDEGLKEWEDEYMFLTREDYREDKNDKEKLKTSNEKEKSKVEKKIAKYSLKENREKDKPKRRESKIRIAFVGKTGHGKSATANTLMSSTMFPEGHSAKSETVTSSIKTCKLGEDRELTVMDSPGMEDTHREESEVLDEIRRVGFLLRDGVNCFIYCLNASSHRFTKEDERVLRTLQTRFGKKFLKHCLIVYTNIAGKIGEIKSLDDLCSKQSEHQGVKELLTEIGWKVVAVENTSDVPAERKRNQEVLIDMIDWVIESNNFRPFQNMICKKSQLLFDSLEKTASREGWHPSLLIAVIEMFTSHTSENFKNKAEFIKVVKSVIESSKLGTFESETSVLLHAENQTKTVTLEYFEEVICKIHGHILFHLEMIKLRFSLKMCLETDIPPYMAFVMGHSLWATLATGSTEDDAVDDSDDEDPSKIRIRLGRK